MFKGWGVDIILILILALMVYLATDVDNEPNQTERVEESSSLSIPFEGGINDEESRFNFTIPDQQGSGEQNNPFTIPEPELEFEEESREI